MSSATRKLNWKRRLTQVVSLALLGEFAFYGVFRCPFAVPYVSCGNCPVMQCPGRRWYLPIWGAVLVSAVVFGRAFCGWACPGGLVSDLLGKARLLKGRIQGVADKLLSGGKYVVLAAAVGAWVIWDNPRWAVPIRTGGFFESAKLTFEHANVLWLWRTLVTVGAIAAGVFVSHAWCRFLCPTGGVLEGMNRISLFRYYRTDECDDCGTCQNVCDLYTRPAETNCNNCGDCESACPANSISAGRNRGRATSEAA